MKSPLTTGSVVTLGAAPPTRGHRDADGGRHDDHGDGDDREPRRRAVGHRGLPPRGVARDDHAFLHAAGDDDVARVAAPSVTGRRSHAAAAPHFDEVLPFVAAHGVARHDERAGDALQLDVERRGEIRHEVGMRAVDHHEHGERPHFRIQRRLRPIGEICVTSPANDEIRIRVEPDGDRLADADVVHVGLVDARAHAHRRGIDDLHHRLPDADFVAFGELRSSWPASTSS